MTRFLIAFALVLFIFPTTAFAQSDPVGDAASTIDMTAFNAKKSGRGIVFSYTFHWAVPTARNTLDICADTNKGRLCLTRDRKRVFFARKARPARVTVSGKTLRVWVRASHINVMPDTRVKANAWIKYESNACSPTLTCLESADAPGFVYRAPTSCASKTRQYNNGSRNRKLVALTFDDGPHAATTQVLNHLKTYNVPATFYINGIHVSSYRNSLRRMAREGHELANHSYDHQAYPSSSSLRRTNTVVKNASGFKPCTFRPPYGATNSSLVSRAGALGMSTIIWDIDTRDWESHNTSSIIRIGSSGTNGSIVLMHDGGGGNYATARAIPQIIKNYRARGFDFVTVDELLNFQPR